MTEDFYDLLDVPTDASQDDIKQAFRDQVRVYHPDLNDDDRAQAQFTALKKAYDILGDPVERQAYDRLGHEDYVAKRTKGLPSPDLWKDKSKSKKSTTESESGDDSDGEADSSSSSSSTSRSSSSASRSTTSTGRSSTSGTSRSSGRTSTGTASSSTAGSSSQTSGSSTNTTTGTTDGGTATAGSGTGRTNSRSQSRSSVSENPLARWWRSQNFAWPLIWLAAFTYLAGLGQFALANEASLQSLGDELSVIGTDSTALWETLSSGRHGIETMVGFVSSVEPLAPPLPTEQWYGLLAGIVAVAVLSLLGARIAWREETWGAVSIDETIVLAVALGVSSTLLGGPLLAGALLMPLLFGVIVHRTRQLPGWSPSYLFVLAVSTPGIAIAANAAGYASLPSDLLAYVVVPLLGAFGLPLRASIRKRFGR
ncbi:J domain-containing protein [Natronoglomus mannanivorans]|uniref:J domain-containing protein n=1 Tax=Natronoglomus mannanivorans TaxID=2979990 RepID=A0AAP3E2P0_9EURY|nr:J domain-containing protein [Halobacteria archaeon AArc-xg1-1]